MADFGFDDWMDAELRNVPVPPDLRERLLAGRPGPSDAQLDHALRGVTVPPDLGRRLRRIARRDSLPIFLGKVALAASVLLLISGGGYYLLVPAAATRPSALAVASAPSVARPSSRQTPWTAMPGGTRCAHPPVVAGPRR